MYGIINKIKGLEGDRIWFILAALFILTVGGTVFFVTQKDDEEHMEGKISSSQIQVLPVDEGTGLEEGVREALTQNTGEIVPADEPVAEESYEPVQKGNDEKENDENDVIMKWPGQGEVITSYGFTHSETFDDIRFHSGIDIALPPGYEVRSALPGRVVSITSSPLWGYELVIKHSEKLETRYKGIKPLKEEGGFEVGKGEVIGQVMTSPPYEAKMKPHLHFEVYEYGKSVDPMKYL